MDDGKPTLLGMILAVAIHVVVIPVILASCVIGWLVSPSFFAVPAGIVTIWLVVRLTKRRDDPRHAKLPPDDQ
jgi:hypothetical protein